METDKQFIEKVALGEYNTNDAVARCKQSFDPRDFYAELIAVWSRSVNSRVDSEVSRLGAALYAVELYVNGFTQIPQEFDRRAAFTPDDGQTPTPPTESLPEANLPSFSEVRSKIGELIERTGGYPPDPQNIHPHKRSTHETRREILTDAGYMEKALGCIKHQNKQSVFSVLRDMLEGTSGVSTYRVVEAARQIGIMPEPPSFGTLESAFGVVGTRQSYSDARARRVTKNTDDEVKNIAAEIRKRLEDV